MWWKTLWRNRCKKNSLAPSTIARSAISLEKKIVSASDNIVVAILCRRRVRKIEGNLLLDTLCYKYQLYYIIVTNLLLHKILGHKLMLYIIQLISSWQFSTLEFHWQIVKKMFTLLNYLYSFAITILFDLRNKFQNIRQNGKIKHMMQQNITNLTLNLILKFIHASQCYFTSY